MTDSRFDSVFSALQDRLKNAADTIDTVLAYEGEKLSSAGRDEIRAALKIVSSVVG